MCSARACLWGAWLLNGPLEGGGELGRALRRIYFSNPARFSELPTPALMKTNNISAKHQHVSIKM